MTDANGKPLSLQVTQEESYCRLDGKAKSGLFHLEIAEPGRYQLGLRYLPTEEKQENMEVSVLLDGKTPFTESAQIRLNRPVYKRRVPF